MTISREEIEIIKHLIGRHDQSDHDPTEKNEDEDKPTHSREDHASFNEEKFFETKNTAKAMAVRREAWNDAKEAGLGEDARRKAMRLAARGYAKSERDKEQKRRKLSKEENNFLQYHLKENTGATVAAAAVSAWLVAGFTRNPNMLNDWMRFIQRPAGRVRTNPNLTKPWKEAFKSGDPDNLKSVASEMFDGNFGSLVSKHEKIYKRGSNNVVIEGGVYDKSGGHVGSWERSFKRSGEVHHDYLAIIERLQGTGFAKEFYKHSMKQYKRNGFNEVTILANIDVGGYAWARQGFQFAPGTSIDHRSTMFYRSMQVSGRSYSRRDRLKAQALALAPGSTPQDFMNIGRSRSWTDSKGIEHWFGKDMLLESNWFAYKAL